jgi:hypothetical protein
LFEDPNELMGHLDVLPPLPSLIGEQHEAMQTQPCCDVVSCRTPHISGRATAVRGDAGASAVGRRLRRLLDPYVGADVPEGRPDPRQCTQATP